MYPILLHRDGARAITYCGPMETPPHKQADLGVGDSCCGRELGLSDHVTCHVIVLPGHVTIPGQRGGVPITA